MNVGIPTEIKNEEHRVAITPAGVRELTAGGHNVLIQTGAGAGSSISANSYFVSNSLEHAHLLCLAPPRLPGR